MRHGYTRQRGVVLIVSLLMLLVMSVLVITAVGSSNTNLQIVNNVQAEKHVEALAQMAIEEALSTVETFETPAEKKYAISGETVTVSPAECLDAKPATGYSATWALAPEDSDWELTATASDSRTGAQARITQGVRSRMVSGVCDGEVAASEEETEEPSGEEEV